MQTFDIKGQKFIKRPDDFKFEQSLYMNDFEKKSSRDRCYKRRTEKRYR